MWVNCAWHKVQNRMQVGGKNDETGWGVYNICTTVGALIVTGHAHNYARSHQLQDPQKQTVSTTCTWSPNTTWTDANTCFYNLTYGGSVVAGVGVGGRERDSVDQSLGSLPHWAKTSGNKYGALFCKYNFNGMPDKAYCYFKSTDGEIVDEFFLS